MRPVPKRAQPSVVLDRLQSILGHVVTRTLLSGAIIVSLLPIPWLREHDLWFLLLFGPEFLVRAVLLFRAEWTEDDSEALPGEIGWRWPKLGALLLMLLDLVALISFIPIHPIGGQATRWLRLFRLTRMLLLVRYWAPLARDLWAVLLRAERGRQVGLMGLVVLVLSFAGAVVLDHLAVEGVDFDGDDQIGDDPQDLKFLVRLWWAFRQIQDPGNMLSSPTEVVTLLLSLALTVFGLFLVSFLIGLGTDVVRELMELSRLRPPGLRGHTVVVNITPATRQVLFELMRHYRKLFPDGVRVLSPAWIRALARNAWRDRRYVTVGASPTPPDFLREPELAKVIYRQAARDDDEHALLQRTDIHFARRIILLADLDTDGLDAGRDPDDDTIRTMLTIVEAMRGEGEPGAGREGRTRLIAEILDESNIPAARRAMASLGDQSVYAQVVATERLLALFIACVARRAHISDLLFELMTSRGHEVYTYDFHYPTSTAALGDAHGKATAKTMRSMLWHGLRAQAHERVVPIGLLYPDGSHVEVSINPVRHDQDDDGVAPSCRGFVGLAPNFRVMADFAHHLEHAPVMVAAPPDGLVGSDLSLNVEAPGALRRILICGFRPASVNLVESLVVAERACEIMILVDDPEQVGRVIDDFDSHTNLVRKRLLRNRHGVFVRDGAHTLRYESIDGMRQAARIHVAAGDRSSSRQLAALPYGFGAATDMDCVVLLSDEHDGADARTTTALMKLEALQDVEWTGPTTASGPRVVAELLDDDLAQRLQRRYRKLARFEVEVFSIQELRAFFMFQSVVVPHFDLVYVELMGPWGQSFVPLELEAARGGRCSYSELARHVYRRNALLVGVELREDAAAGRPRTRLYIAEGPQADHDMIDLSRVERLWVIEQDASDRPRAARGVPVESKSAAERVPEREDLPG